MNWLSSPNKLWLRHLGFWVLMYTYYVASSWTFYAHKWAMAERYLIKMSFQIVLTYWIIWFFVPRFLRKGKYLLFSIYVLLVNYLAYVLYSVVRHLYYDPKYADITRPFDLWERSLDMSFFLNEITWLIFPAVVLTTIQLYQDQKEVYLLREQKRMIELNALKNQLNPHFLFNTLNNIYTLALKKSDRTPTVIAKLSEMLDYMLYHCSAPFVSLVDEVKLLNNYLELESVRYGQRLELDFDYKIGQHQHIAPLILLTIVENAFKHGVKEEIDRAKVWIRLETLGGMIHFSVENTIPVHKQSLSKESKPAIGQQNIRKQLDILYQDKYSLEIVAKKDRYLIELKLPNHEIPMSNR